MRTRSLACVIGLVAPLLVTPALADKVKPAESQMECKTITVQRCDSTPDGKLYNCRDEKSERCTVVSGPGSGKAALETPGTTDPPTKKCSFLQKVLGCREVK